MDDQTQNKQNTKQKEPVISPPPISAPNKEQAPISSYVEKVEQGPQITQGVSQFVQPSQPAVPHVPEVGLTAAAEEAPVKTEPTGAVSLPMTEREAESVLKSSPSSLNLHEIQEGEYVEDSRPFLAALVEKIYQKMRGFIRKPA